MTLVICRLATKLRFDRLTLESVDGGKAIKVLIEEPLEFPSGDEWTLAPFPGTLKDLDKDLLEGIMMHNGCTEMHAYLEFWAEQLLSGKSTYLSPFPLYYEI
jgi:hypothetical protein